MSYKNTSKNVINISMLIFILALCFICSTFIITVAFFSSKQTASGIIKLGELDFSVGEEISVNTNVLPNTTIDKQVFVINSRNINGTDTKGLCDILFRFNYRVFKDGNYNEYLTNRVLLSGIDNYIADDSYIYYCDKLSNGNKVNICEQLSFLNTINNEYQGEEISVMFNIEAIQAQNGAYLDLWTTAPLEWIDIIKNSV